MIKRTKYIVVSIIGVIVFIIVAYVALSLMDRRFASTDTIVKQPSVSATEESGSDREPPWGSVAVNTSNNGISVRLPMPYADVASPVIVAGDAIAFESTVSITVRDADGRVVGRGFATADAPDAGQSGPYRAAVAFNAAPGTVLYVEVFEASAKDGTPIHMVRIPVRVANDVIRYSVFLSKEGEQNSRCDIVHKVSRAVPETQGVARAALQHLIAGPTREEWEQGYRSIVPSNVELKDITITNGTARADFSSALNRIGGSCAVEAARAQIETTLKQFSTISSVVISVDGDAETALQP